MEKLLRGSTGVCTRTVCECERLGLGNECIYLRPTDEELERRTNEPHIDGYPLYSGLPKLCQTDKDSWNCPNMKEKENDTSMTHEHYECKVCGRLLALDYGEMR